MFPRVARIHSTENGCYTLLWMCPSLHIQHHCVSSVNLCKSLIGCSIGLPLGSIKPLMTLHHHACLRWFTGWVMYPLKQPSMVRLINYMFLTENCVSRRALSCMGCIILNSLNRYVHKCSIPNYHKYKNFMESFFLNDIGLIVCVLTCTVYTTIYTVLCLSDIYLLAQYTVMCLTDS